MSHNVDYPGAIGMWIPDDDMFTQFTPKAIVIHKTGDPNAQMPEEIAQYFINSSPGPSVHYIVGLDGSIVQCVPEALGAGGNCCLEKGYDSFWNQYAKILKDGTTSTNLNTLTFSIEHVDPTADNSTNPPQAQLDASFKLVLHLCKTYNIAADHIMTHASIDPQSRARCPGNYPIDMLRAYVAQQLQVQPPGKLQQAKDTWNSTTDLYNTPIPTGTGIYAVWLEQYMKGQNYGPPITQEFSTVDWQGTHIQCQWFGAGTRIEYYTENVGEHTAGENHAYSLSGGRLF